MEKKHYIIPIFVPHLGCPKDCVFCNQKNISGQMKEITKEDVINTIEYYLNIFGEKKGYIEIAFFGGSFTGIKEKLQEELLATAYQYIKNKKVDYIRISTRPDYIDKTILKRLKKYKVKIIELGVQSSNDYVLKTANRGHTFDDVKKASKLIRKYGFTLGHQMMVGLPESTRKEELQTAIDLAKLKPKLMRIYPVLVVKGTRLEQEYLNGEYIPLNVDKAVEICKEIYKYLISKKINVIRIGLQTTDLIANPENENSTVVAGPYHEAFRQLVEDEIWYDNIIEKIKQMNVKVREIEVCINPDDINNVIGHKKNNVQKMKDIYNVKLTVKQDSKIKPGKFKINVLRVYTD